MKAMILDTKAPYALKYFKANTNNEIILKIKLFQCS